MRAIKRLFLLLILCAVVLLASVGWLAWYASQPTPLAVNPRGVVDFDIRPGVGFTEAAREMQQAGVGVDPWLFSLLARLTERDRAIQSGSYEVALGVTPWLLLEKLTNGDVTQTSLVIVEGKTFRDLRLMLNEHPDLQHDSQFMTDAEIMHSIGAVEAEAEGRFFPDTYLFARQSSDLAILRRAYYAMRQRLESAWENRAPGLPYRNIDEALIMASLIEKETGRDADRGAIASVFVNRLRRKMLLQTDPSVIYGLGASFDGNLRRIHLTTDTPWNTYTRPGLPPTPIALPGMASIAAALNPPQTDYLYFVASGDGATVFSKSLAQHNAAVRRYQLRRR